MGKNKGVFSLYTIYSAYGYDTNERSLETALSCNDPSRAVQEMEVESNINTIVERFGLTGVMPVGMKLPSYEDFSSCEVFDFRSAVEAVHEAEVTFMSMPAAVRERFNNDPQQFLVFVTDEKNLPEMEKLGLLKKKPEAPIQAPPADGSKP